MLAPQPLKIALPAPMKVLQPAQLAALPQGRGAAGQLTGQGGEARRQRGGLSIPEQQSSRQIGAQLGRQLGGQRLLDLAADVHEQPGGLAAGQGFQPAQVSGGEGCAQVMNQAITGLKL